MRAGGVGGALVILCCIALGVHAQPGLLYLNEEPLSLDPEPIWDGAEWLVPVEAFALQIGLEATIHDDTVSIRGPGFRQRLDLLPFQLIDGTFYAPPSRLLELISGRARRIGDAVYLSTEPASVTAVEVSSSHVTVRLSEFTSHIECWSDNDDQGTLRIRWPHSKLEGPAKHIRIGSLGIQEVVVVSTPRGVDVLVRWESGMVFGIEQIEGDPSYAWTVRVTDAPYVKASVQVAGGVTAHEWSWDDAASTVRFVYAEAWRQSYRLQPIVSPVAFPQPETVDSLLSSSGAIAAVPMGGGAMCAPRSLIVNGIPYAISTVPDSVLAVDVFGRWQLITSPSEAYLQHEDERIPLDGVNRPLSYGEIVAYVPGYVGAIALDVTGDFAAMRVRDGRVVSIYRGPFVSRDASTMLVVASGDSSDQLLNIRLGDPIHLHGQLLLAREALPHVCSSGSLLMARGSTDTLDEHGADLRDTLSATVLACDWHGGLYLLSFRRAESTTTHTWVDVLRALPTAVRDAVLLSTCAPDSLAYRSFRGPVRTGASDPVLVSLGLIPLHP